MLNKTYPTRRAYMNRLCNYLFSEQDDFDTQRNALQAMLNEIACYDGNKLLNTNTDDLVAYFESKYRIDIPTLHENQIQLDHHEETKEIKGRAFDHGFSSDPITRTGTKILLEVPFTGDPEVFRIKPSTFNLAPPIGTIKGNVLIFEYWNEKPDAAHFTAAKDKWLTDIKQYLGWQQQTFHNHNTSLADQARQAIEARKQKLLSGQNMVASLGIPLKRSLTTPQTYSAPEVRRKITPPPASQGTYVPEPVLEEAEYQNTLKIMDNMVHVMERSPKAFHDMNEEGLRTHFLMQLNGQYEGKASGEVFNYEGKTDILVRSGDKNIFIAECKFWNGPKALSETIDQLLGYLHWRDSKSAILIFNRNKNFTKVLEAIPSAVKSHPNYVREDGCGETHFRYIFRHKDDPAKLLYLTVLAYDIPTER
jgi:hypothetical protein